MGIHYILLPQTDRRHIHPSYHIAKPELRYFYLQLTAMGAVDLCHPVDSTGYLRVFWLYPTEQVVDQGDVLDWIWTSIEEQLPHTPVAVPGAFMDWGKARGVRAVRVEHFITPLTYNHVCLVI